MTSDELLAESYKIHQELVKRGVQNILIVRDQGGKIHCHSNASYGTMFYGWVLASRLVKLPDEFLHEQPPGDEVTRQ